MRTASRALGLLLEWVVIAQMVALTAVVVFAVVFRNSAPRCPGTTRSRPSCSPGSPTTARRWPRSGASTSASTTCSCSLPARARAPGIVVAEALILGFFALLAWSGWRVLVILEGMSLVSLTLVPVQLTQSVIPIGAVLFVAASLLSLPDYWRETMAGRSFEHPEIVPETDPTVVVETRP